MARAKKEVTVVKEATVVEHTEYRYHVEDVAPHLVAGQIVSILNEFGKDGWKLIDVYNHRRYTFMRQTNDS